ncbi:MAG TPA: c-type cytochrome [Bryobacteraceae bacterium]|nr:c-type cytochrome [Bryobacteraceae bacterium]
MKALFLLAAVSAAAASAQTATKAPPFTDADRAAGARIFRSHCAPCHGVKGTGGLGPNLTSGVFFHGSTDADLYRNISEGIVGTAMPSVFFDGAQVWQIVAFVRSISQSRAGMAPKGDPVRGQHLFQEKGCIGCHQMRGEGGSNGPDLSVIGAQRSPENLRESILDPNAKVAPQFWVAKIITSDGKSHSGFVMNEDTYMVQILDSTRGLESLPRSSFRDFGIDRGSRMPSYKDKLSDAELDDLVSFLSSLKRQKESHQ